MTHVLKSLFLRNEKFSAFSIGALMLVAVVMMGLVSLTTLNKKATKGYLLNELEAQRQELITDGEVTEMMTLYARSMTTIEGHVSDMHKPGFEDISYVMPVTAMAQK